MFEWLVSNFPCLLLIEWLGLCKYVSLINITFLDTHSQAELIRSTFTKDIILVIEKLFLDSCYYLYIML